MLLLRMCKRCETLLNIKAFQIIQMVSTRAITVSKENDEILKKLGFAKNDYKKVLPKQRTIRELNLERVVDMLNRLGFTAEEIRKQPNVLWLHPYLIDHRFKLLEESGVERKKITLEKISKFPRLNTTVIRDLKKTLFIAQETDVARSILSFSDVPRELYPPETSDDECLGNAQTTALQTYISWRFGLSKEEVQKKYQSYEDLHQKSIRLVMQCLDVLIQRFELSENKIKQNIYLLEGHPDNFMELLERIPKIGDITMQHIVSTNPKLLMRPIYKVLKVLEILKKYKILDEGIACYSYILTLSPETVKQRVAVLYADPVFRPFFSNPRICFVIYRYNTAMTRSRILTNMKWRCLTVHMLTTLTQNFQKRLNLGHDDTRGADILHYLKRHLGYSKKDLRKQLKLHPFFYFMPLTVISDTTQLLLESDIDKSDIFKNLPIVLYPKEKVQRWLTQVHSQPEVQSLHGEEERVRPSLVLPLVLYYMERPYQFSGHGVWSEKDVGNFTH